MNLISLPLQHFINDSIHPNHFKHHILSKDEIDKWNAFLTKELNSLIEEARKYTLINRRKDKDQITAYINRLVSLSNTVNTYLIKNVHLWSDHVQSKQIREQYIHTCNRLEWLMDEIMIIFPNARSSVLITNYQLPQVKMELKNALNAVFESLHVQQSAAELVEIFSAGVKQMINQKGLTYSKKEYLNQLLLLLSKKSERSLNDLLIINDFNLPEFFHYQINTFRDNLNKLDGLHDQLVEIIREKDRLYNLHIEEGLKITMTDRSLFCDLNDYLTEKKSYIRQLIKIRREVQIDVEKARATKILINLPVPQFGLFIRMQVEKGFLSKEHIGELFSFFASHFYTQNTAHISADSLQKKSTDVEFSTAQKMKAHLIGMLNWLNTNYNLSNFNSG
ncbi:hypothetical protein [Mucilaginibacter flavus]|uniref:hypothetical protein n=1 Tax=Mucilaginibacter flavus TaxID=931504 RepID=UPI0025B2B825|nr:hypothetical protein [Mucilaginibacter flavus]MDN3584555.1 hypothetical protein [Mucilaginibacter flavus]